ncbi:MAG: ABC transporter permease [bacterium]|nr:ABC transporter permease [bacterium]MCP4968521.1 ABC transporter permease [bacterium]
MTERESASEAILDVAEGISAEPITQWDLFVTRLRRHRLATIAFFYMGFIGFVALLAPLFTCQKDDTFCGRGPVEMSGLTTVLMLATALLVGYFAYRSFVSKLRGMAVALTFVTVVLGIFLVSSWGLLDVPHVNHYADQLPDESGRILVNIAPRGSIPLGTDDLGRDVLARVIHGGRASLAVGLVVGALVALLGTVIGSLAGYYPGVVDQSLMRFTDLVLGLPLLPVAIVVGRVLPELQFLPGFLKQGAWGIAVLVGLLVWGALARIVRAEFLSLREKEFVEAARAAGASDRRIIFRHILPNALSPIIVQTTLIVGTAIILEAALSFLGFGVRPPIPTWGGMAASGASIAVRGFWWELVFSAGALISTVLAINFIGDGLRDALDPTQTIERK